MNADIFLAQGSTHAVCQDYAAVREEEERTTIAVCDGCSSSPHTDIGARLLARSALRQTHRLADDGFGDAVVDDAAELSCAMGLPREALDATLIVIQADVDEVRTAIFGDGAMAIGYVDGAVDFVTVEYASNAPEYLSYRLSDKRHRAYQSTYGDAPVSIDIMSLRGGSTKVETAGKRLTIPRDRVRWIAAMTDGVGSFTRPDTGTGSKGRAKVDTVEVARELLDYVNVNGKFVERQMRWFLSTCDKRGWKHADDLGIAAIAFEE